MMLLRACCTTSNLTHCLHRLLLRRKLSSPLRKASSLNYLSCLSLSSHYKRERHPRIPHTKYFKNGEIMQSENCWRSERISNLLLMHILNRFICQSISIFPQIAHIFWLLKHCYTSSEGPLDPYI